MELCAWFHIQQQKALKHSDRKSIYWQHAEVCLGACIARSLKQRKYGKYLPVSPVSAEICFVFKHQNDASSRKSKR
jgi:hypothetical protein